MGAMGVGQRLRVALGSRSIRWLHEIMEEYEIPGCGYSNIQRYVAGSGGNPPPLVWIEIAANALEVRAAWLAFGDTTGDQPTRYVECPSCGSRLALTRSEV